jgi:formiminoglutamate deiminase
MHFASALLPDGWADNVRAVIVDGRFQSIERGAVAEAGDERIAVALPGMCNVHSHAFQRAMAGRTEYAGKDADNFWSWRELMYRSVAEVTPEDMEAVCAQAFREMLEGGFTRVGEFHYLHHDAEGAPYANPAEMAARIAAAAQATGIGLTLLPVFYAHSSFGGQPPHDRQRRFVTDLDAFARLLDASRRAVAPLPDALVGVAPHSLRAVTPAQLREVVALGAAGPIHIHAAEQLKEVEDCVAWSGARPVQWLLENAPLDDRWCLVHATHQTPDEVRKLAASGAVAGFCPVTEANLGDGIAPARALMAARGSFGIGTDSNVSISVGDELRMLEYGQRLQHLERNVLSSSKHSTGRTLFESAVQGGARATGLPLAGIVAGGSADFFSLDMDSGRFAGRQRDALLDTFIFATRGRGIDGVWRAGRQVVSHGRHAWGQTPLAGKRGPS